MNVIDMIAVRDRHVSAAGPVLVFMAVVRDVRLRLALVHVVSMGTVQATVVNIVDMIAVRDGHVSAAGSMLVGVRDVLAVFGSH
ncbi:hypothetical protein ACIBQ1_28650 [Nonomuraea sp. NPDC050153]|uniref:hypothetical protein n=1 Tax=Nonomuraea sp. NPDC050153 TaxID=3364359 RepID=UPI00379A7774